MHATEELTMTRKPIPGLSQEPSRAGVVGGTRVPAGMGGGGGRSKGLEAVI